MNIKRAVILMGVFCLQSNISAGIPLRMYGIQIVGIEYSFASRSQTIIDNSTQSYEKIHLLNFYYIPLEYIRFSMGVGIDQYKVAKQKLITFNGNYGLSLTMKLCLFSPEIAKKNIRFTTQSEILYSTCQDNYDYYYKSIVFNPSAGIIIHIKPFVDIELGGKAHVIQGEEYKHEKYSSKSFSNTQKFRGYSSIALISLAGSYFCFTVDMSPEISRGWNKKLNEASIGFAIGIQFQTKKQKKHYI